jgi:arylsulfatase A-like enzyme
VSVELETTRSREILHEWAVPAGRWGDARIPVPAATRSAQLLVRLAAGDPEQCRWSSSAFVPSTLEAETPNVLMILGDTVRRDALGAYGAPAGATPILDALAASGVRFDQARAQSSWTLPSVASLFTSRWCHEVTNWADQGEKIPEAATTLAELFRARGYATAGFTANVLLQKDTGFTQGFESWWVPAVERSLWTDALTTADRVIRWLGVHQRRPFLCYVHLVDPHSPYCPPERRPKDPGAPVPGDMSRSFWGKRPLPDAAELSEWRRLYAEEVRLLDRGVGRILSVLEPEVRRRTHVVFVSDHGEEFLEHGFIGHGWSLYDELLRVPLLVAGPGLPAGRVVREPVGLVDLLPTLAGLAGIPAPAPRSWRGVDLSSGLRTGTLAADRTFLAQTYHYAPLRLAVQQGLTKAVFFNRGPEKLAPPTSRTFGAPRVRALLPVEAYFDLTRDPAEKANLAGQPDTLPPLRAARDTLLRALSGVLPGTWFVVRGPGNGGYVRGTVRYGAAPKRLIPLFAREGESLHLSGAEVRVSLRDDGSLGAWLLPDADEAPIIQVSLGVRDGVDLPRRAAASPIFQGPGWASFSVSGRGPFDSPAREAEQVERLRALGYLR